MTSHASAPDLTVPYHDAGTLTLDSMATAVWYNRWLITQVAPFLGGDILDAGCGSGTFSRALSEYGTVWAVDADPEGVRRTRAAVPDARVGLGNLERGEFFFGQRQFDTVFSFNVLEHIADDRAAAGHLWSCLAPGGHLVLIVPAHQWLYTRLDRALGHFRRYSKQSVAALFPSADARILQQRRMNWLGALGWVVAGRATGATKVSPWHVRVFERVAPLALATERVIEPPLGTSQLLVLRREFEGRPHNRQGGQ